MLRAPSYRGRRRPAMALTGFVIACASMTVSACTFPPSLNPGTTKAVQNTATKPKPKPSTPPKPATTPKPSPTAKPTSSPTPAVTSEVPAVVPNPPAASSPAPTSTGPAWGAYTGAGPKGATGAAAFSAATGLPITEALDFGPLDSWKALTKINWLLAPYHQAKLHLEFSLPMLPNEDGVDLATCAAGYYNQYWTLIGQQIVGAGLPTTTIRPGWEMNGNWYKWSAVSSPSNYAACFRQIVTTMRAVQGAKFTFDFNPNIGPGTFPAELAYPGDAYVDEVGVDVYDTSWTWYPTPWGTTGDQAKLNAWNYLLKGDHGLNFWSAFAAAHGKPLSITEWGMTWRSDGHAGGDDVNFMDQMLTFITSPANHVVRSHYFNSPDSSTVKHDIVRSDTIFPKAVADLRQRAPSLAAG